MSYPPLLTAADLQGLPGAPFSDAVTAAACAKVRTLCGWHVAPEVTETITIDGGGGLLQWLPTRHVTSVTSVQMWDGDVFVDLPGWSAQTGWSSDGFLASRFGFPAGMRSLQVTLTHGYSPVPDDLKLLVAVQTGRQVVQEVIASRSITFSDSDSYGLTEILDRYRLGPRP